MVGGMSDALQVEGRRGYAAAYVVAIVCIVLAATLGWGDLWAVIYEVPYADKVAHVVLLGGLTIALDVLFRQPRMAAGIPTVAVVLLLIASVEECLQAFVPTRTFDLLDLACNYAGIVAASLYLARQDHRES